jgi:hypothetical protein
MLHRQSVLLELAAAQAPGFQASMRQILKTDAELLGVSRVSYWSLAQEPRALSCDVLYLRATDTFEWGAVRDARTREFSPNYLEPQGISSMLDVPSPAAAFACDAGQSWRLQIEQAARRAMAFPSS